MENSALMYKPIITNRDISRIGTTKKPKALKAKEHSRTLAVEYVRKSRKTGGWRQQLDCRATCNNEMQAWGILMAERFRTPIRDYLFIIICWVYFVSLFWYLKSFCSKITYIVVMLLDFTWACPDLQKKAFTSKTPTSLYNLPFHKFSLTEYFNTDNFVLFHCANIFSSAVLETVLSYSFPSNRFT